MILGVVNQKVIEYFTVCDTYGNLITGIDETSISVYLYNPSSIEVSGTIPVTFTEIGDGNYKYEFTPNVVGTWYLVITNTNYFPWGKADDIQVNSGDLSSIYDSVIKTLGLVHHNIYIDNPVYDENGNMISARVRIYSNAASVGTSSNVIETYRIEADGTECGQFSYWKQVTI